MKVLGGDAEHPFDLLRVALGFGGREVDLVEDGDDIQVVLKGQVAVGEGLGLDALGGVDDEDHTLTGGQRTTHLVVEVHVAGSVDQVDDRVLPFEPDALELDGDAPFAFEVHRVEVLGPHQAGFDRATEFEHAIGQRGLAVVHVGDDRRVAQSRLVHRRLTVPGQATLAA